MPEKLKSRKFWITLFTQLLVVVVVAFLGLPEEQAAEVAAWLVGLAATYIASQGYADGQAARRPNGGPE